MTFEVWAPHADRVQLHAGEAVVQMQRVDRGRGPEWFVSERELPPGTRYGFDLDDGQPLPDPRSGSQPEGVHADSETVDHGSFPWTDQAWRGFALEESVIYELHVGTFTAEGTFDAVLGKLDHLLALGVTAVEVMPVAEFPGTRGWGYDGVGLFAPHHAYGGPAGLKRLVDGLHAAGLGVILDVVYNHLGPSGNYLARFGPYFTDRYVTPWGQAVNLDDRGSCEVREFICDNALMWLRDYHIDALRLDAIHAIVDTSATHILEELALRVDRLEGETGRRLYLIAESDLNDPRIVSDPSVGGYGLDATWSDDFHHSLHVLLTQETSGYYRDFGPPGSMEALAKAMRDVYVYDGRYSQHRERVHGRSTADLPGSKFLAYLQNHDQVGNRAQGERSAALMNPGRLKIAAAVVLTSPFVPMLFQGEEWGASTPFLYFTDHSDPDLARSVSEGRKQEFASFGWDPEQIPDPQDLATFDASKLKWEEIADPIHDSLLGWHRSLIALRRGSPELLDGRRDRVEISHGSGWMMIRRGSLDVAFNLGPQETCIDAASGAVIVMSSDPGIRLEEGRVCLPPDSVAVLRQARRSPG